MILLFPFLLALFSHASGEPVEEFHAHGPMDFNNKAMDTFMKMRKLDPNISLNSDGPFLKRASEHAVKRLLRKPEQELTIKRIAIGTGEEGSEGSEGAIDGSILELPPPEGSDTRLTAALNAQGSSALILPSEARAQAVAFNEEIGMGAISKTGALPMGGQGEWLELAEKKMKKEESLDYQSLLWELGSEVAESEQTGRGGLNVTYEEELLKEMQQWFAAGGGKLKYLKPVVSVENGFELLATEDVEDLEPVITAPLKLIMCKQTARNVVIPNKGKYLGDELKKTFEKNELWGMSLFLLHEYFKEVAGKGSKWGPFIRTLRMRFLSTPVLQEMKGTIAGHLQAKWTKGSDKFMWWSVGSDGPCSPTTGICKPKPLERAGETRFNIHQIRWAYWVVKQNAVKIKQMATGLEFIALIPYYNMMQKRFGGGGKLTFDLDGSVSVRAGGFHEEGMPLGIHPGNISDSEFFLRYLRSPQAENSYTDIRLTLPGVVPKGSKFHYCLKGTEKERNKDDCKATYRSEAMFWKSKVLTEWRQLMNLPPRMQELRMWATRLHLYGGEEEMALLSNANRAIAGLPFPVEEMPAEEQLMLLGIARSADEAALILSTGNKKQNPDAPPPPAPQLYSAPDPEDDWEAQRGMENLATLAVQAQNVISSGNLGLNATEFVLNQTRDFFVHGVLPKAGLDELDLFLLKKIGMLSHCGFEDDMKITNDNITQELMCAMRVHLMNESEVHVFCPKDAVVWEDNCMNVEFLNYTAISEPNELNVITALRSSIHGLLESYPNSKEEDEHLLDDFESGDYDKDKYGPIMQAGVKVRFREKTILHNALDFLEEHEKNVHNGTVPFQLALKAQERIEADLRDAARKKFLDEVKAKALERPTLASVEVDMGDSKPKQNLTLEEGRDLLQTVQLFCKEHGIKANYVENLATALRARVVSPEPLLLMIGVVVPTGQREILAIPQGANSTVETGVFCARYDPSDNPLDTDWCKGLLNRVEKRINTTSSFLRRIILVVPVDAPDTRKLKLVIREGEQHDIMQFVSDFFQLYHMPLESLNMMANEVAKRLPAVATSVPVGLGDRRQVVARFSLNENITAVVEGFVNFYELDDAVRMAVLKRAHYGMAPGTFMM